MSWTPILASAQASVIADGRVLAGPMQLATAPGSAPDAAGGAVLAGAVLAGAVLAGAVLTRTAVVGATLAGAELGGGALAGAPAGTALVGIVPGDAALGVAMDVTHVEGGVGADAAEVMGGDADDKARGVAAAETEGMLDVGLPLGEHAVKASASPSTAPAANFPKK